MSTMAWKDESSSGYRYPAIESAIIERILERRGLRSGHEERIIRNFRDEVIQACSKRIGKYLRDESHRQDTSQAELARQIGKQSRATVHTWFTHGIQSFSGLVLAISALDLEWADLPCPTQVERTIFGYVETTTHIRQREFHERDSDGITREEWEYLWERFCGAREWETALAEEDAAKLERLAGKFSQAVAKRMGRQPIMRKTQELLDIFKRWQDAFVLCLFTVPVAWLES